MRDLIRDDSLKISGAVKWSSFTEILAKLVSPITNMILARILSPESFGIVTTVTMVISFVDIFTDAGFQRYLVQHQFKNNEEMDRHTNVAFWTNLSISLLLWYLIALYSDGIANLVGNPGLGNVIAIACISLPLTSFSSIQMALYRRSFNYKTLFYVRIIGICLPFIITIPLAILGGGYWALILGTISGNLCNAILLTINSPWKPKLFYEFDILREMLSFSMWSLMEALSIWLTTWIGTFIVATKISSYYLGLYKTSMNMVNSLMSIVTGATTPILFAALSRYQEDDIQFQKTLFKFQRLVSAFVIPLGVGIFIYRDFATNFLLGEQWEEASLLVGLWGLTSSFSIVLANYCSEVFRSKGKPKLSFLSQIIHLVFLIPTCLYSANYGYETLVYMRSFIRIQFIITQLLLMRFIIKIPIMKMIKNIFPFILSSLGMTLIAIYLRNLSSGFLWSFCSIIISIMIYFCMIFTFPQVRNEFLELIPENLELKKIIYKKA